jgi:hypothetical protein
MLQIEELNPDRYWLAGGTKPVPHMTAPAERFAIEQRRLLDLHVFLAESATSRFIDAPPESPEEARVATEIFGHVDLIGELILVRAIDSFLSFVAELLGLIYSVRPESLRSSETERLDFILQFESIEELREAIAERRVSRLSFQGLRELQETLLKQMSFPLFDNQAELDTASLFVEYRNLFVHNRGVVNRISVKREPTLAPMLGKRLDLSGAEIRAIRQFFEHAVFDIDVRAAAKFQLPVKVIPAPPVHL